MDYYQDALYNRALAYYSLSQFDLALTDLNQITINEQFGADYFLNLGNCHYMLKKYPQALSHYDTALKMAPNYALAFKNRGDCKDKLKDKKGAKADWQKAKDLQ